MKAKKRILASVISLLAVVFCAVGLTACSGSGDEHTHQWGSWSTTKIATCIENGLKERTCLTCGAVGTETMQKTSHTPNADDGDCTTAITCSLCGAETTPATAGHVGGTATCQNKAVCTTCGMEYGELGAHTPNEDDGDCTTAITCSVCEAETTAASAHVGGTATCQNKAVCTTCDKEYGELSAHVPEVDDNDCTTPTLCSVCGVETTAASAHVGGTANCQNKATCTACGKEYGEFGNHVSNADDGDCTTAITCSLCGTETTAATAGHVGGTATCSEKATCTTCGMEYGSTLPHVPNADDNDCTTAITCSVCGAETTPATAGHVGGTANCQNKAVCTECETEYGEFGNHVSNADDGDCTTAITCSLCGEETTAATAGHVGGTATCSEKAVCTTCGMEYGETLAHEGETIWVRNPDVHYLVYSCCSTQASTPEAHTMVGRVCTVCGLNTTITISSIEVNAGESQVTVSISISNNPGITGLMATIEYADVFTLSSATSGEAFESLTFTEPSSMTSGCKFMWDGTEGDIRDGEILTLTFDVSPTAPAGEYVILLSVNAYDNDLDSVTPSIAGGKITINNN